jgi:hypothetical protein
MPLYRDIADCLFTDTDENEYEITGVSAIQVSRGGKRISHAADDDSHLTLVDSTDHTTTVIVYLKNIGQAVGSEGAGAQAPPLGVSGSLTFTVKTGDGGSDLSFQLGDSSNTFARFMGGGGQPKHADVECGASMKFRGYCPDGDTCPLSSS